MIRRLALFALAVAVYLGALGAPFVFDDHHTVVGNPSIRDLGNLRWIFIGSRRFVTNFSYAVDWTLFGGRPFGFHLTNIVLHALVVLALYELARRVWQNDAPALFAAALFAVHPLLTESVAYVSSRPGLLCALFLVAGTYAFHRALSERRLWLIPALICWPLAAASKETGLLLPVLWVACDVLFIAGWRRRLPWYAAAAVLGLAAAAWRVRSFVHLESGALHLDPLAQAGVFWRYVFLWIVPAGLSPVHSVTASGAWLGLASLAVAVLLLFRLPRPALFGGLWVLVLVAPSSLMPLIQQMAEHRVYEAAAGAALISAAIVPALGRRRFAALAIIVIFAAVTVVRVQLWRHPARLWEDAARKAPREWLAHYAFADALRDDGDCAGAIGEYDAAIALKPDDGRAPRGRAICLALTGQLDAAEGEMQRLLQASPADATLHYNLGILLAQRGQPEEARKHFLRALELDPTQLRPCDALRGQLPPVCARQIR